MATRVWLTKSPDDYACARSQRKENQYTVKDEFTRRCLALRAEHSFTAQKVRHTLEELMTLHGPPAFVRSDNGPEFIAHDLTL